MRGYMYCGSAIQFYRYNRNSYDDDFWMNSTSDNFDNLLLVFKETGYAIEDFTERVSAQKRNIPIEFAPLNLDLE